MRIGHNLIGTNKGSSLKIGNDHGLTIQNDTAKMLNATKNEEFIEKKKITKNFETNLTDRLRTESERLKNGKKQEKTEEEITALVDSVMGVIDQIRYHFGEGMATETMANVLKNTDIRVDGNSIALSIGDTLKAKSTIVAKLLAGKATQKEVYDYKIANNIQEDDPDFMKYVKRDSENLEKMVEFLNKEDGVTNIQDKEVSSLSSAINTYFGEVIIKDEDRYMFTERFDWLRTEDAKAKNREYFNEKFGFDFKMTVEELGRENLGELVDFLRNDLQDEESAAFIETLKDSDDIFAAINYLYTTHYVEPTLQFSENFKNSDSYKRYNEVTDDAERAKILDTYMSENSVDWDAEIEKNAREFHDMITDPNFEYPKFDYNSGFFTSSLSDSGDFNTALSGFVSKNILDKVNEVIRDDKTVRERFVKVAAQNFGMNESAVPENYGLTQIPSMYNMASFSTANVMGVMDTTFQERALNSLKQFTPGAPTQGYNIKTREIIDTMPTTETSLYYKKIYDEAYARYQEEKGLLFDETL
jgi:hypothetical protein